MGKQAEYCLKELDSIVVFATGFFCIMSGKSLKWNILLSVSNYVVLTTFSENQYWAPQARYIKRMEVFTLIFVL